MKNFSEYQEFSNKTLYIPSFCDFLHSNQFSSSTFSDLKLIDFIVSLIIIIEQSSKYTTYTRFYPLEELINSIEQDETVATA